MTLFLFCSFVCLSRLGRFVQSQLVRLGRGPFCALLIILFAYNTWPFCAKPVGKAWPFCALLIPLFAFSPRSLRSKSARKVWPFVHHHLPTALFFCNASTQSLALSCTYVCLDRPTVLFVQSQLGRLGRFVQCELVVLGLFQHDCLLITLGRFVPT